MARVGKEAITARDVVAEVAHVVEQSRANMPPEQFEEQRSQLTNQVAEGIETIIARRRENDETPLTRTEQMQRQIIRNLLQRKIQTLLICADAQRTIPEEGFPEIEKQLEDKFNQAMIPTLMERMEVDSRAELEKALRDRATSLERERRDFVKQTLSQHWLREQVEFDEEITYQQMLDYYRENAEEFDREAQTIWEELVVRFSNHPNTEEARQKIVRMGNAVLKGTPFAELASEHSDGITAEEGGRRVWPSDDLLSADIEAAVTGLPEGKLSPIIRDWRGFHIVRVVERRPAGRVPFEEAQAEIRQKIKTQRLNQQINDFVAGLKERTSVWTVFDDAQSSTTGDTATAGRPGNSASPY